jgi:hypothetical protein
LNVRLPSGVDDEREAPQQAAIDAFTHSAAAGESKRRQHIAVDL